MFTPSARAAFHRLAARAHERAYRHPSFDTRQRAVERTDEAWSASFGPDGDRSTSAHGEEQEAALDANEAMIWVKHREAATAHRRAAKWARAA